MENYSIKTTHYGQNELLLYLNWFVTKTIIHISRDTVQPFPLFIFREIKNEPNAYKLLDAISDVAGIIKIKIWSEEKWTRVEITKSRLFKDRDGWDKLEPIIVNKIKAAFDNQIKLDF